MYKANNAEYMIKSFNIKPDIINYLVNISEKSKASYFEISKVACSTIKRNMQIIEAGPNDKALNEDVHDKNKSPLLSPCDLNSDLHEHFKNDFTFTFVRNPYHRILSCYLDKIAGEQWEKNIRLPQLGFSPNDDVSFFEFLCKIKDQNIADMDIHWMPQYELIGRDNIKLDYIGRFECFSTSFPLLHNYLLKRAGYEEKKLELKNISWHSTKSASKIESYYDEKTKALIYEIFEKDFEVFGYSKISCLL